MKKTYMLIENKLYLQLELSIEYLHDVELFVE